MAKAQYANPPEPKKPRKRKPKPGMLGSGAASKAGGILKNRRKQQMKDLGI